MLVILPLVSLQIQTILAPQMTRTSVRVLWCQSRRLMHKRSSLKISPWIKLNTWQNRISSNLKPSLKQVITKKAKTSRRKVTMEIMVTMTMRMSNNLKVAISMVPVIVKMSKEASANELYYLLN